ncbi:right-handed parallel beta-helix repeat-containing protein [Halorarum halophilum]|uniref:Right-handed parallel beta-helix repeat-containing protein n=1 Tax=Halorarum halophilum TaxID=2743090 RepID=A0A7D5GZD9_9EURY|nr:right-handed parallel beta-helix repeat-containing protein [Halobaculum halophilum]QLG29449.1 right-handed parallel beta-helix repeat-containing protein [Halobaculum halophilum]
MPRKLNAIALTAIMVVSLFAGGTVAASEMAQQTENTAPTEITACTVIDSPGHYALTQDIVRPEGDAGPCIEIRASDVTLDGNGHTLDGNDTEAPGIVTTAAHPVENVTIANLTVRGNEPNIKFEAVTTGQIVNVSSLDPEITSLHVSQSRHIEIRDSTFEGTISSAVAIDNSEHLSVVNNTITAYEGLSASGVNDSEIRDNVIRGSGWTLRLSGSENTISNNTIEGRPDEAITVSGSDNTVIENSITLGHDGIVLSGSNHTVADNHVDRMTGWAATAEGVNHTFRNNSLSGGEPEGASGGALRISGEEHVIENNSLNGFNGVYVASATGPISIENNSMDGFRHIVVAESKLCPDPGVVVTAHGNVFDPMPSSYQGEIHYGILNHDDDMVNATNNYWGASDGPSSHDGENVTDPVTGEPANGSGMPVSEGVHFDPHLEDSPANETDS